MAKYKQVERITSMDVDFAQWYTDVCTKAELIDYSGVKGFFILRPYGYAIWENIQSWLDREFKLTGHENVSMPLLIPESLLQREKDHVQGFAPECAWVTMGGEEELPERLCVRPTSETLFCDHWKNVLHSWRDLPMKYNQWCSVLRWEKTTRPFLRGREFLWQEGHTIHATAEEARAETQQMLEIYARCYEELLAMPVIRGIKTEKEKFAGAEETYTVECMMHDHKALQSATSHYFGDGFTRAFGITFQDKSNQAAYPYQTSWGFTTRSIGGIIMTHGDDNGLILPPRVAPIQVILIPVAAHKGGVAEAVQGVLERLQKAGIRAKADFSDNSPGWKFAEYEMKGVPLRLELGPRDLEKGTAMAVRRDTGEKAPVSLENLEDSVAALLEEIQHSLFLRAEENRISHTWDAHTVEEVKEKAMDGFVRTMWCGDSACEEIMKEKAGVSSRCIPFQQEKIDEVCPCCGRPAKTMVLWGIAY